MPEEDRGQGGRQSARAFAAAHLPRGRFRIGAEHRLHLVEEGLLEGEVHVRQLQPQLPAQLPAPLQQAGQARSPGDGRHDEPHVHAVQRLVRSHGGDGLRRDRDGDGRTAALRQPVGLQARLVDHRRVVVAGQRGRDVVRGFCGARQAVDHDGAPGPSQPHAALGGARQRQGQRIERQRLQTHRAVHQESAHRLAGGRLLQQRRCLVAIGDAVDHQAFLAEGRSLRRQADRVSDDPGDKARAAQQRAEAAGVLHHVLVVAAGVLVVGDHPDHPRGAAQQAGDRVGQRPVIVGIGVSAVGAAGQGQAAPRRAHRMPVRRPAIERQRGGRAAELAGLVERGDGHARIRQHGGADEGAQQRHERGARVEVERLHPAAVLDQVDFLRCGRLCRGAVAERRQAAQQEHDDPGTGALDGAGSRHGAF